MGKWCCLFVVLSGAIMSGAVAAPGSSYGPPKSPRLVEFKKTIGFENALAMKRREQQVIVDWDTLPPPPELDGWTLEKSSNVDADGTRFLRFDFTRNDEQVNLSVDVFHPRNNRAGESLLLKADAVTTMTITDIRGPRDLGTLSLMSSIKSVDLVYWICRNVFVDVSTYKTDIPAISIARWLQKQMELNTR